MTHSLHRSGPEKDLKKDFVVMCMPSKGITDAGSTPKVQKHLAICSKHNPINLGGAKIGAACVFSHEQIINNVCGHVGTYNAVFSDKETVVNVLREEIEEKIGLSIVISGVYEETKDIAKQLGIKPHTVNFSLGVWGKRELLPEPEILEIATWCGHGLISHNLVRHYFDKVAKGYSAEKAAKEIATPCYCAIANLERIAQILERGLSSAKTNAQ